MYLLFFIKKVKYLQIQWKCPHLNSYPTPLTSVSEALKMEIRVKVSSSQTEPISSFFMDFLSRFFFLSFLRQGGGKGGGCCCFTVNKRERPHWCYCFMSPVVKASLYCGAVRRFFFLTHNDSYSASHPTSEASAEERSPPRSEPPRSVLSSAAQPGWCTLQKLQKHALAAPRAVCSWVQ